MFYTTCHRHKTRQHFSEGYFGPTGETYNAMEVAKCGIGNFRCIVRFPVIDETDILLTVV